MCRSCFLLVGQVAPPPSVLLCRAQVFRVSFGLNVRYIRAQLGGTQSAGSRGLSDRQVGSVSQALVPRDGTDFKASLDTLVLNLRSKSEASCGRAPVLL